jgi:hypothetical protein
MRAAPADCHRPHATLRFCDSMRPRDGREFQRPRTSVTAAIRGAVTRTAVGRLPGPRPADCRPSAGRFENAACEEEESVHRTAVKTEAASKTLGPAAPTGSLSSHLYCHSPNASRHNPQILLLASRGAVSGPPASLHSAPLGSVCTFHYLSTGPTLSTT